MRVPFGKYHGLGNDFIVVDLVAPGLEGAASTLHDATAARWLCDRRFGIGADGVLVLRPPSEQASARRLSILNADGSEAEMCGNGVRCVAKFLYDRDRNRGQAARTTLDIETRAGRRTCRITVGADGLVAEVSVAMGVARLLGPVEIEDGQLPQMTRVSMGNPHAVIFRDDASAELAGSLGAALARHPVFGEAGSNVEFARVERDGSITVHVWERGSGLTLACGTGACAVAAAACSTGRLSTDREIVVRLPGGPLSITISQSYEAEMRGPAAWVFDGEVDLDRLPGA